MSAWYPRRETFFADAIDADRAVFQGDIFRGVPIAFLGHPAVRAAAFAMEPAPSPEAAERSLTPEQIREVATFGGSYCPASDCLSESWVIDRPCCASRACSHLGARLGRGSPQWSAYPRGVGIRAQLDMEELHLYSLDEYHRLVEAGGFDEDERVELLDGLLVSMSPKTPRHERAVRWLASWLMHAVDDDRYEVGVGSPLTLASSEPEPDLTVLERTAPNPYHPASAALAVEVAVSSLARDLGVKAAVYAAAGVPEYWVLDLAGRRMLVHRQATKSGYAERFEVAAGLRLTAEAVALPALELDELLHAADA